MRRHTFIGVPGSADIALQDDCGALGIAASSARGGLGATHAAPNRPLVSRLWSEMVVADLEWVAALSADGLLRGAVDPNEAMTGHQVLPSVSLSTTARRGPAEHAGRSRARSAAREPLTAGAPV